MTWQSGEHTIRFLLERGRLEDLPEVDADAAAEENLERAEKRRSSLEKLDPDDDPEGTLSHAYDVYRFAAEALLAAQGLRSTGGEGGHRTVEDAISAQFGEEIAAFAKLIFERMRGLRHGAQYVDPGRAPLGSDDARWVIEKAVEALKGARTILDSGRLDRFRI